MLIILFNRRFKAFNMCLYFFICLDPPLKTASAKQNRSVISLCWGLLLKPPIDSWQ